MALVLGMVAMVIAILVGLFMVLRSARDAASLVERAGEQALEIAERFRAGTITTTFLAALPEMEGAGIGRLELATSTVTEVLTRSHERTMFWDAVSLGETVVEIRVPVTYRYHVELADPWTLEVSGQTCVVHAPQIRPSLPPAIHTDRLEKRVQTSGWFALDGEQELEELERSLTPVLSRYAGQQRHLDAVRESARKTVANFVRAWLLREDHWREDRFHAIVVRFPDDPDPGSRDPEYGAPTIRMQD